MEEISGIGKNWSDCDIFMKVLVYKNYQKKTWKLFLLLEQVDSFDFTWQKTF